MAYYSLVMAPGDTVPFIFDFTDFLRPKYDGLLATDVITSAGVKVQPTSLSVGEVAVSDDGMRIRVMLADGIIDQDYRVTVTVQTQAGLVANCTRQFRVTEEAR